MVSVIIMSCLRIMFPYPFAKNLTVIVEPYLFWPAIRAGKWLRKT